MTLSQRLASLAVIMLLNEACTTISTSGSVFHRFDDLEMSRDFSGQTINQKPFVVNVIGLEDKLEDEKLRYTSAQADQRLTHEFNRVRPDLSVQELQLSAADETKRQSILKRFAVQQEFPADGYTFLKKPSLAEAWFLIAHLENMTIDQRVHESDIRDDQGKRVDTRYTHITSRKLGVRYFVYDPELGHLVFTGLVRSSTEAAREKAGVTDEAYYPEAPGLSQSLTENFEQFLRALPAARGH
jgi:hypothetical protein